MNLQKEVDKLDCIQAEKALASLGGRGSGQYFCLYNFIMHVKRLQSQEKLPLLLKGKNEPMCREAPSQD